MKKFIIFFLIFTIIPLFAMERTGKNWSGIGSNVETTYSTSDSSNATNGYSCIHYDWVRAYISVSTVTGSGVAKAFFEGSVDGSTWFSVATEISLDSVCDTSFYWQPAGQWFRLKINYQSGTSLIIDDVEVEAGS